MNDQNFILSGLLKSFSKNMSNNKDVSFFAGFANNDYYSEEFFNKLISEYMIIIRKKERKEKLQKINEKGEKN